MTAPHDPQLLKGVLSLLLLRLLGERESYGYEVVQRLQALGLTSINEGSVYPALARLEREGRIQAQLIASSAGPARKYYWPTAAGVRALADGTASWLALSAVVTPVLVGEPSAPSISTPASSTPASSTPSSSTPSSSTEDA